MMLRRKKNRVGIKWSAAAGIMAVANHLRYLILGVIYGCGRTPLPAVAEENTVP